MKLVFFCSSLEPGHDGVGDYTRRLAEACVEHGHACTAIALHDRFRQSPLEQESVGVRILRLPATTAWSQRVALARDEVARSDPAWLSWQYVSYGFHPKGFLEPALLHLRDSLEGRQHHMMLHELWVGLARDERWRARLVGSVQRRGVLRLVRRMRLNRLHTSNETYATALSRENITARVLDLYGNVPIVVSGESLHQAVLARFLPKALGNRESLFVAMTFGTLHPQWQPAATAAWLRETAERTGRKPVVIIAGRAGGQVSSVVEAFHAGAVQTAVTGEQDPDVVSHLLQAADCGIAPHPWALIGKSGVATAMREHGLPVLVPRDEWRLRGPGETSIALADTLLAKLSDVSSPSAADQWLAKRRAPESLLPRIARQFLESLR